MFCTDRASAGKHLIGSRTLLAEGRFPTKLHSQSFQIRATPCASTHRTFPLPGKHLSNSKGFRSQPFLQAQGMPTAAALGQQAHCAFAMRAGAHRRWPWQGHSSGCSGVPVRRQLFSHRRAASLGSRAQREGCLTRPCATYLPATCAAQILPSSVQGSWSALTARCLQAQASLQPGCLHFATRTLSGARSQHFSQGQLIADTS